MTTRQIQNLLDYLGYTPGQIDGIMGGRTRSAIKAFRVDYGLSPTDDADEATCKALTHAVCYGMPEKDPEPAVRDTADITALDTGYPYFTLAEFRCKCADPNCPGKSMKPSYALLRKLVDIRTRFGQPVTISSGIRCEAHNRAVGGVPTSYHLSGRAADISVRGCTAAQVLAYCSGLQLHYCYSIDKSYVHIDI